ncbi:MAG: GNAT family N-acetyltransferase [Desulfobacterales bacterium]|nr:GNAT family N-acetyltransferase [Desulfobacterales bacterium]
MTYSFSTPDTDEDGRKISVLLNKVFHPQKVGDLAATFFTHLPGLEKYHWFTMTDDATGEPVASFTLIPWTWEVGGIRLEVAEMGLVGTLDTCRGKGMMRKLNAAFDAHVKENGYDLCMIQGIPGFYHNFGYYYAVELEYHIDLSLALIPERAGEKEVFLFRRATLSDIDFLMSQDESYRRANTFSVFRSREMWDYLLTHSKSTEYGADFWIIESGEERYYARVPFDGFGHGLILSEVSEDISHEAFAALAEFFKALAQDQDKAYIRINLHPESRAGQMAMAMGATHAPPYALQIKIPDRLNFLNRIRPVLEKRTGQSIFKEYSGKLRLDLYTESFDLEFIRGNITITRGDDREAENIFCIPGDLFGALVLGYRSWKELQQCRPDIFPANQHLRVKPAVLPDEAGLLVDVLFPKTKSWIYERY